MKRKSGFKVVVPDVLDTFVQYGLPIYICLDKPLLHITFKPSQVSKWNSRLDKIISAISSTMKEVKTFFKHIEISIENNGDISDSALYAALLFALYEEHFLGESIQDLVLWLDKHQLDSCDTALCKTMICGGIYLSSEFTHERIYGSYGLYVAIQSNTGQSRVRSLDLTQSSLITTAFLKDRMHLLSIALNDFENKSFKSIDEYLGNIYDQIRDSHIIFLSQIVVSPQNQYKWIGGINQKGIFVS